MCPSTLTENLRPYEWTPLKKPRIHAEGGHVHVTSLVILASDVTCMFIHVTRQRLTMLKATETLPPTSQNFSFTLHSWFKLNIILHSLTWAIEKASWRAVGTLAKWMLFRRIQGLFLLIHVGFRALSKSYAFNIQVPCQERSSFLFPFFVVQLVFGL